jgi:hypothetical protein
MWILYLLPHWTHYTHKWRVIRFHIIISKGSSWCPPILTVKWTCPSSQTIFVSWLSVTCVHDVKVTKHVPRIGTHTSHATLNNRINNVLVFDPTRIVKGNIPTEYIWCESVSYSIEGIRYVDVTRVWVDVSWLGRLHEWLDLLSVSLLSNRWSVSHKPFHSPHTLEEEFDVDSGEPKVTESRSSNRHSVLSTQVIWGGQRPRYGAKGKLVKLKSGYPSWTL